MTTFGVDDNERSHDDGCANATRGDFFETEGRKRAIVQFLSRRHRRGHLPICGPTDASINDAQFDRADRRIGSIVGTDLAEYVLYMLLDSLDHP